MSKYRKYNESKIYWLSNVDAKAYKYVTGDYEPLFPSQMEYTKVITNNYNELFSCLPHPFPIPTCSSYCL
jgi:hypothetical protein